MKKCQRCESNRIFYFSAKCSDMFGGSCEADDLEIEGYPPTSFIGKWEDYVEGEVCLNCGQMVGDFPVFLEKTCHLCDASSTPEDYSGWKRMPDSDYYLCPNCAECGD